METFTEIFKLGPVLRWFLFILANAAAMVVGGLPLLRCRARKRRGLDPATFDRLRKLEAETRTMMERPRL